jgi:hypothetical protein
MWAINAISVLTTVSTDNLKPVTTTRQLPLFFLDGNVHGIKDAAGAEAIARRIINPTDIPICAVHISAVKVS